MASQRPVWLLFLLPLVGALQWRSPDFRVFPDGLFCTAGQCGIEQLPLLEKMQQNSQPDICTAPPPAADFWRPIREVLREHPGVEGECYFNFFPTCTAAGRARDYTAHGQWAGADSGLAVSDHRDLGGFRTAEGVSPLSAKMCHDHGWLDLPYELLANASALEEAAEQHCAELESKFPGFGETLSWAAFPGNGDSEGSWGPFGWINLTVTTADEMLRREMWKCELGPRALACDMAECIYNYCRLPDGRVGSGRRCRRDWMDESDVKQHFWRVFGPDASQGKAQ